MVNQVEITRPDGNLKREVWNFSLNIGYGRCDLYLDRYSVQTKETTRHKWHVQGYWQRLDHRVNTITDPPIPTDVESEMKSFFQKEIVLMPITR